jgi:Arc/MetJ family transcription regulator
VITNIDIDETIVAQAMQLSGARTKREVVDRALRELVARATRPSVRELFGIGGVEANYDPKAPWAAGSDAGQDRIQHSVHEPVAIDNVTLKKPTSTSRRKKV